MTEGRRKGMSFFGRWKSEAGKTECEINKKTHTGYRGSALQAQSPKIPFFEGSSVHRRKRAFLSVSRGSQGGYDGGSGAGAAAVSVRLCDAFDSHADTGYGTAGAGGGGSRGRRDQPQRIFSAGKSGWGGKPFRKPRLLFMRRRRSGLA